MPQIYQTQTDQDTQFGTHTKEIKVSVNGGTPEQTILIPVKLHLQPSERCIQHSASNNITVKV